MEATQESQSGWYTGQTRDVAIMYTALFMTFIFKLLLCRFRWLLYIKWQHNRQWHWPWKGWVSTAADNFSVNGMPLTGDLLFFSRTKFSPLYAVKQLWLSAVHKHSQQQLPCTILWWECQCTERNGLSSSGPEFWDSTKLLWCFYT